MTGNFHSPNDLESAKEDLRRRGLRATPARMATLQFLRTCSSPRTHAEVAQALEPKGFDKATVFRNLNDLSESQLLRRTELGDHVWRFEAVNTGANEDSAHPHFVCIDCGSVTCLEQLELSEISQQRSDGIGIVTEILLRGHCRGCQ